MVGPCRCVSSSYRRSIDRRAIIARVVILTPSASAAIEALVVVVAAVQISASPRIAVARITIAGITIASGATKRAITIAARTSIQGIVAIAAKPACALLIIPPIRRGPVWTLPVWCGSIGALAVLRESIAAPTIGRGSIWALTVLSGTISLLRAGLLPLRACLALRLPLRAGLLPLRAGLALLLSRLTLWACSPLLALPARLYLY